MLRGAESLGGSSPERLWGAGRSTGVTQDAQSQGVGKLIKCVPKGPGGENSPRDEGCIYTVHTVCAKNPPVHGLFHS